MSSQPGRPSLLGVLRGLVLPALAQPSNVQRAKGPIGRGRRLRDATPMRAATYTGDSGTRGYYIHVPAGLADGDKVPLVVALHGCSQTPQEFAAATRLNALADSKSFVVLYPEQTSRHNIQRCWNWFDPDHQNRGTGEPEILHGMLLHLLDGPLASIVDRNRVYLLGLSAGGAMALVLGANYPEVFAAIAVHSTPLLGSASTSSEALRAMAGRPTTDSSLLARVQLPPMIAFQGLRDRTVRPTNAQQLSEQWLSLYSRGTTGLVPSGVSRHRRTSATTRTGREYTVDRWYRADGHKVLESWQVDGLGHAWSGGRPDARFSDPAGPRASTEMWRFLASHRLAS
jgi:poly(hydroxyalkanoate) depolymerase family esterase